MGKSKALALFKNDIQKYGPEIEYIPPEKPLSEFDMKPYVESLLETLREDVEKIIREKYRTEVKQLINYHDYREKRIRAEYENIIKKRRQETRESNIDVALDRFERFEDVVEHYSKELKIYPCDKTIFLNKEVFGGFLVNAIASAASDLNYIAHTNTRAYDLTQESSDSMRIHETEIRILKPRKYIPFMKVEIASTLIENEVLQNSFSLFDGVYARFTDSEYKEFRERVYNCLDRKRHFLEKDSFFKGLIKSSLARIKTLKRNLFIQRS